MAIHFIERPNAKIIEFEFANPKETVLVEFEVEPGKRGPKPSGKAKKLITLRVDPDIIEGFKATGDGWQSRMNDALRKSLGLE